jgi:hypothetical protein
MAIDGLGEDVTREGLEKHQNVAKSNAVSNMDIPRPIRDTAPTDQPK